MFGSLSEGFSRFFTNLRLDFEFISTPRLGFGDKTGFMWNKYASILIDKRVVNYLGSEFEYDNRFVPAMLQVYPREIFELDGVVDLNSVATCLDIGANIGQFSYTLKKFFPHLRVFSFEPMDETFQILSKNLSGFKDVKLFNMALGDKDSMRDFYFSSDASAEGSFIRENLNQNYVRKNVRKVKVKTVSLSDSNTKRLGLPKKFDLVKIDVEGAEEEVLKSIGHLDFRYLYIEVSTSKRKGSSVDDVKNILESFGKNADLIYYNLPEKSSPAANAVFEVRDKI